MKKFLVFTVCALFALTSFAQTVGVNWEHGTLQEALNKAKANKKGPKLVFLDCFTTWCGPCKNMANNVFPTKEAGDYFNKKFVNIKIDMEKGEGIELAKKYSVAAYPTFLVLDTEGNEIGRVVGGGDLAKFIKKVEDAMDVKNSPKYIKGVFEADKNMDNAIAYLKCLEKAYMKEEMGNFIAENLSSFKPYDVFSEPMWQHFSKNLPGGNPKMLAYLIENKMIAASRVGDDVVNKAIVNASCNSLMQYLMGKKELTKEEVSKTSELIKLLSESNDNLPRFCAKVAPLYADKNMEEICKMYKFMNLASYGYFDISNIERIYGSIKEMPKANIEQYYQGKIEFHTKQIDASKHYMEEYTKGK